GAIFGFVDGHVGLARKSQVTADFFFASTGRSTSMAVDNFITASYVTQTGGRNDITGTLAYRFTPTTDITVEALGRVVLAAGMTDSHLISLWRVSDQSLVAAVTVTPSSLTDSQGFKYALLFAPIRLTGGVTYVIGSSETSGSADKWLSDLSLTGKMRAIATIPGLCYANGAPGTYPSSYYTGVNSVYGPATFYTAQ
ncbi:MAG TPA: DUF4082 domain-containing protein, partial [Armatimonadota bacterium]|nr:DUF4082 domain-containing protein [Armatimonadota bacterium]